MSNMMGMLNRMLKPTGLEIKRIRRPIENRHQAYFLQSVKVSNKYRNESRMDVLPRICEGKSILHVGCVDSPITNVELNLHIRLDKVASHLVGVDPATETFNEIRPLLRNPDLFGEISEVGSEFFDYLLVPEVLEHIGNPSEFLRHLNSVNFRKAIFTVPDAFVCSDEHFEYREGNEMFYEAVHPDHNCWYTPYTLRSTLSKYTDWLLEEFYFIDMSTMVVCSKPARSDVKSETHQPGDS